MSLIAAYRFSADSCNTTVDTSDYSPSLGLGSLTGADLDCTAADDGVVSAHPNEPFRSANTMKNLNEALETKQNAYTVELWIKQPSTTSSLTYLLQIEPETPDFTSRNAPCELGLNIFQDNSDISSPKINVDHCGAFGSAQCWLQLKDLNYEYTDNATHLVVTVEPFGSSGSRLNVTANGVLLGTNTRDLACNQPFRDNNVVKMLDKSPERASDIASELVFEGRIYAFNMFAGAQSLSDVKSRYEDGLPALPTAYPSSAPSTAPSSSTPSAQPTAKPSAQPTMVPTTQPTVVPSAQPTAEPTVAPSSQPTPEPSAHPSVVPSAQPTSQPSAEPSAEPSAQPTSSPSTQPSAEPSAQPTSSPSTQPSAEPSAQPTSDPSVAPSTQPTSSPSTHPTAHPTAVPSLQPTAEPSAQPTSSPAAHPTSSPSASPTAVPSVQPTAHPTAVPSPAPSPLPTVPPTAWPSRTVAAPEAFVRVVLQQLLHSTLSAASFRGYPQAVSAFETAVASSVGVSESDVSVNEVITVDGDQRRQLLDDVTISVEYSVRLSVTSLDHQAGMEEALAIVGTSITEDASFSGSLASALSSVPGLPVMQVYAASVVSSAWQGISGTNSLLASFGLSNDECVQSGQFADTAGAGQLLGTLNANPQGVECLERSSGVRGVKADSSEARLISSQPLAAAVEAMNEGSFSLELWLRLGDADVVYPEYEILAVPVQNRNLCVSQFKDHLAISHGKPIINNQEQQSALYLSITSCVSFYNSCELTLTIPDVPLKNATHVVVTHRDNLFSIWVDGVPRLQEINFNCMQRYQPSNWGEEVKLQLLGYADGASEIWPGDLHLLSVHSDALQLEEVAARYSSSFPNSRPWALSTTLTIKENGEEGDHSLNPEFYDSPIPVTELARLELPLGDFDDTESSPLYNASTGPQVKLYIVSLPTGGTFLYQLDGSPILQVPTEVLRRGSGLTSTFAVRARPPLDVFSEAGQPLFSFSYEAEDGLVAGLRSKEPAYAAVVVVEVNKPPIPRVMPIRHVAVPRVVTVLPAFAGDDNDGVVVSAGIATLPTFGELYDVAANGNVAALPLVLPADGSAYLLTAFRVAYKHTAVQNSPLDADTGEFGLDSFLFVVIDNDDLASRTEVCTLSLRTALQATPHSALEANPAALQSTPSLLRLYASDLSMVDRQLYVRIVRLPWSGGIYKSLSSGASSSVGEKLLVGEEIEMEGPWNNASAQLFYTGHNFSTPSVTGAMTPEVILSALPDSFEYEVLSADGALSLAALQAVHVRNKNVPTEITFELDTEAWPLGHVEIYALSMSTDSTPSQALLTGFSLQDPDLGADTVHVQVSSARDGKISLNAEALDLLEFTGPSCYTPLWNCEGSGDTDNLMDFVSTPYWAERALNGLVYQQYKHENIIDNITVQVWDGEGGQCKSDAHGSTSLRSGCFHRSFSLDVHVLSFAQPPSHAPDDDYSDSNFNIASVVSFFEGQLLTLVAGFVVCLLSCRVFYLCTRSVKRRCCGKPNKLPSSPNTLEAGGKKNKGKGKRKGSKGKKGKAQKQKHTLSWEESAVVSEDMVKTGRNPFDTDSDGDSDSDSVSSSDSGSDTQMFDTQSTASVSSDEAAAEMTAESIIVYTSNPYGGSGSSADSPEPSQPSQPKPPPPRPPRALRNSEALVEELKSEALGASSPESESQVLQQILGEQSRNTLRPALLSLREGNISAKHLKPSSSSGSSGNSIFLGRQVVDAALALNAAEAMRKFSNGTKGTRSKEHPHSHPYGSMAASARGSIGTNGLKPPPPPPRLALTRDEVTEADNGSGTENFEAAVSPTIFSNNSSPASVDMDVGINANPLSTDSLQQAHMAAGAWRRRPSWFRRPSLMGTPVFLKTQEEDADTDNDTASTESYPDPGEVLDEGGSSGDEGGGRL